MKWLLLFMLLLCGGFAALFRFYLSSDARHERAAMEMIRVLALDDIQYNDFMYTLGRSLERGRISEAQHRCAADVRRDEVARLMLPEFKAHLTQYEMETAARFYRGGAGTKFVRGLYFLVKQRDPEFPVTLQGEEPRLDIDEFEELWQFMRTPIGKKSWDLTLVYADSEAIPKFIVQRLEECKRVAGASASI